jgi:2-haloalkanoic acid dehalogenase type II
MSRRLTEFKVLTFDCYGTLIDWETGIWDALQPLLMANPSARLTRAAALAAFGEVETAEQERSPRALYPDILASTHRELAGRCGLSTTPELDAEFGASIPHWPAFADTAGALHALKARYRLVILSNVDRRSIAATNRKLGVVFDAIYTAEDIGSYKPSPRNFHYMLDRLAADFGLSPTDVLHTAQSLYHDHVPAKAIGLASAWIDRQGLSRGGSWGATAAVKDRPAVDFTFLTLGAMAEAADEDARRD